MVRISERTFEIRTHVNGRSGRVGVKGRDERQSTAPLTPPRPQREFVRRFPLTAEEAVIHGAQLHLASRSSHDRATCPHAITRPQASRSARPAIPSPVSSPMRRGSIRRFASTGASKTNCTGCWTWPLAKMLAANEPETQPRTSRCSIALP